MSLGAVAVEKGFELIPAVGQGRASPRDHAGLQPQQDRQTEQGQRHAPFRKGEGPGLPCPDDHMLDLSL